MKAIRVLIASAQFQQCVKIAAYLEDIEHIKVLDPVNDGDGLMESLTRSAPDLVIVDADLDGDGFASAVQARELNPGLAVIMIIESFHTDAMFRAIRAGVHDVLLGPPDAAALHETIMRVYNDVKTKEAASRVPVRPQGKKSQADVITFFSSKGGVGKTQAAINTAAALAQRADLDVVLLELDTDFGTLASDLNLQPFYTLSDIIEDLEAVSERTIGSYLTVHESGIRVLPGTSHPHSGRKVSEEHTAAVMTILREVFDFVIIDLPSQIKPELQPALMLADRVMIMATPEVSTLRNTKSALLILENMGISKEKLKVILNRSDGNGPIRQSEVMRTLEYEISGSLRNDAKSVSAALNEGKPLVQEARKNSLAQDYRDLADRILAESGHLPAARRVKRRLQRTARR